MGKIVDISGMKFGCLTAIRASDSHKKDNRIMWECLCDCGNTTYVSGTCLRTGHTKSCGCHKYGNNIKHGDNTDTPTRLYRIWAGIKNRCRNKTHIGYKYYGGKGISLCTEWDDYVNFKNWSIKNGYEHNLTIDRVDCNKDYCPDNCRWVSYKIQNNNTTRNHYVTAHSKTMTLSQWADENDISCRTILARIRILGWNPEDAVTIPPRQIRRNNNEK